MGSTEEPMPWSERRKPPWTPAGAIGTGESGLGNALILLTDASEGAVLSRALRKLGWRVTCPGDKGDLDVPPEFRDIGLVFTDELAIVRLWSQGQFPHLSPEIVAVVENRRPCILDAFRAGAEWYMVRPIDPDDPLGVVEGAQLDGRR